MRLRYLLTDKQRKLIDQLPIGDYEGSRAFYELWNTIKDPKARKWLEDWYDYSSNETDEACFALLFEIFEQKAITDGVILRES